MKYLDLIHKLEDLKIKDCDLQDCEITANQINSVSFLIVKDDNGKVVECIVLSDERFEAPKCYCEGLDD